MMVFRHENEFSDEYVFRFYHEKFTDTNNRRSTHCLVFEKSAYDKYLQARRALSHDKQKCDEAGYYIFKFDEQGKLLPGPNAPKPVAKVKATCRMDCDKFIKRTGLIKAKGRAVQAVIKLKGKETKQCHGESNCCEV